ncbi:MAG: redoxin domain-containing protein [Dehalococcoidales bacterium]|jgi:peroxiredoxin
MNRALKVILLTILASGILATGCSTPAEVSEVEAPEIGKAAPSFQLTDIDGQTVSLSDFQGKPVLLNFWATWCGPCRFEMPYIQEVYNERSEPGLVILAINIGESFAKVKEFMQDYNLSFPVLLDLEGKVAEKYNILPIPTTYFIDSDGIIRDMQIGAFRSVAEIEDILSRVFP